MEFNGTFLATIITFIVFVFLMNKILYTPILNIMEKRQNFIDENYKIAEDNLNKISTINEEKNSKLIEAKGNARKKYLDKLNEYKRKKSEHIINAQEQAKIDLTDSQKENQEISDSVKDGLKEKITDLANDIVEKVLGYKCESQDFDKSIIDKILYK